MYNFEKLLEDMRTTDAKEMLEIIGVPAIYTLKNLAVFEERIKELINSGDIPYPVHQTLTGFFLGETIVRNIRGAYWSDLDSTDLNRISIALLVDGEDKLVKVFPFNIVNKLYFSPMEYDLVKFYKSIKKLKKNKINPQSQSKSRWKTYGNIQYGNIKDIF